MIYRVPLGEILEENLADPAGEGQEIDTDADNPFS